MVIKGILEQITTSTVNLVNADLLAKTRGLRIIESTIPSEGRLASLQHPPPSPPPGGNFMPYCVTHFCLTRGVEAVQRGSPAVTDLAQLVCLTLSCSQMLHT